MSFQQKSITTMLGIMITVYAAYFIRIFRLLSEQSVNEIEYKGLLLIVILTMTVMAVIAHIVIAATKPDEAGEYDERDQLISLRSSRIAGIVLFICAFSVLGLVMNSPPLFWVAQALIASLALSDIVLRVSMLVYYSRGA